MIAQKGNQMMKERTSKPARDNNPFGVHCTPIHRFNDSTIQSRPGLVAPCALTLTQALVAAIAATVLGIFLGIFTANLIQAF